MSHDPNLHPQWSAPTQPSKGAPAPAPLGTPAYARAPQGQMTPTPSTSAQVRAMAVPHPEPETYPHLLRTVTWERDWWRPLVGIVILALSFFILGSIVTAPVLIAGLLVQAQLRDTTFIEQFNRLQGLADGDLSPAALLYLNLTLASVTLFVFAVMFFLHRLKPGWSTSVLPRMRWKFFLACLGLSVVAIATQLLLGFVVPIDDGVGGALNAFTGETLAYAIIVLLTTPLQAIGEEYAFRGYLLFATGSLGGWVLERMNVGPQTARRVGSIFAVLFTALLFGLAHGSQNFPLFFDRFAFGIIAATLVIITGGLEAGIALHILNNLTAFGLSLSFGDIGEALTVSEASWWNIPLTLSQNLVYLLLCWLVFQKMGLSRRTRGLHQAAPQSEPVPA